MKQLIPITLMLFALLMPIALAQYDWEAVCMGDVLVRNKTITVDSDVIPITDNTTCPYGCDAGRRECTDYSGELVGDTAMVFTWLAWLNFALAFVGVAIVIYAMFIHFKKELT